MECPVKKIIRLFDVESVNVQSEVISCKLTYIEVCSCLINENSVCFLPLVHTEKLVRFLGAGTSNHISFSLNANVSGTVLYKSRILFEIFEQDIDTEKTNYLTITLPHFDLCFLEFERYDHELIFLKDSNELVWQGKSWKKQPDKSK